MLIYHAQKSTQLSGKIKPPGDKSISHRAIMLGSIANGNTVIEGFLMGEDNLATINAMRELGVKIDIDETHQIVTIHGVGLHGLKPTNKTLDCGNSGTAVRLLSGLLSAQAFNSVLTGDASLQKRPMERVITPLTQMGATIKSNHGLLPLEIKGQHTLRGIHYNMPIASAQVKSAILLAGLYTQDETTVTEPGVARDHTERMLNALGCRLISKNNSITLPSTNSPRTLNGIHLTVPSDISSAAFFMVAASITPGSQVTLQNIGINPSRIGIINILKSMGADIRLKNQREMNYEPVADIELRYHQLTGIEIKKSDVPLAIDEFPVLFVAATQATGKTILRNAKELRVKETDRIQAMAEGLRQLGIKVEVLEDGIIIHPGKLKGATVNSYGDHRIAMAFAVAACVCDGGITIKDCDNVATSFPNFTDLAKTIGMSITVEKYDE